MHRKETEKTNTEISFTHVRELALINEVSAENKKVDNQYLQLSYESSGRHICGASIISPNWAVTAAHCTDG
jgi:secreted trypsin-like serine protease